MNRSEPPQPPSNVARRPLVSVVIVNFNAWPEVENLTRELLASPTIDSELCEVVVVDNASDGPIPEPFLNPVKGLHLIDRRDNGGFAVGVNAGWRRSRGSWILLLNPDLIASHELLGQIIQRLEEYDAAKDDAPGIVGYALRNEDGSSQPSVGAFPNLLRAIWEQFLPRSRRKYQTASKTNPGPVDWVTGACMLVDARLLEALGGLDEEFFLYYEEVALCRAAANLGRRVEYDPGVEVVHLHPLQTRPVSPLLRVVTRHSKLLYFRKFRPRWEFLILCGIVNLESTVKGLRARLAGDQVARRTWETVGVIERQLRDGAKLGGQAVLKLAQAVYSERSAPRAEAEEWLAAEKPAASQPR